MTQPAYPPAQCGTACTEQHTYRLDECALCTANLHGGYASPAWTIACPRCHTPANRPCLRRDGTAASVDCQKRWTAYDKQQATRAKPTQPRHTADSVTDDDLDQLYAYLEHVEQVAERCFEAAHEKDLDRWRRRADQAEAALNAVRAWCDQLDARTRELTNDPAATHPIAEGVRMVLDGTA